MKYRKKVVVEAEQFELAKTPWPEGVYEVEGGDGTPYVDTPEGPVRVFSGDWIITGAKSEEHLCKPDIFEQTYEKVSP